MKYIIDVSKDSVNGDMLCAMAIMADSSKHYIPTGIKAIPYDESEAEQRGQEEAWELACLLYNVSPDVIDVIYQSVDDRKGLGLGVAFEMPYAEAKAKYEAWQKRENEIKVGDEVRHKDEHGDIMVYTGTDDKAKYVSCIKSNGRVVIRRADKIERTGRHFNEVAELLKKMRKPD